MVTVITEKRTFTNVVRIKRTKLNIVFLDLHFEDGTSFCIKEQDVLNLDKIKHLFKNELK